MNVLLAKMKDSVFNRSIWEGLARGLRSLGHEVSEVDDEDVPAPETLSPRPDLLFAVHGGSLPVDVVDRFRAAGIRTAVYLLDEPYEVDRSTVWARHYETVFSVDSVTVPLHARFSKAFHLPLAYDETTFRTDGRAYASELLVLGSPFAHRLALLAPLREIWGDHTTWVGPGWRPFCPRGRHVEQLVSPDVCARFYRGAEVVINIHRDSKWSHFGVQNVRALGATHLNPRFWEAAGCGAFQLVSQRDDLARFSPDTPAFSSAEELLGLLDRYGCRPRERQRLARLARRATSAHTYAARAAQVCRIVFGDGAGEAPGEPAGKVTTAEVDN